MGATVVGRQGMGTESGGPSGEGTLTTSVPGSVLEPGCRVVDLMSSFETDSFRRTWSRTSRG